MKRQNIYLIIMVLLILTVPWLFVEPDSAEIMGLPSWGFYSFVLTVIFAFAVSFLINKYWDRLANDEGDEH